MCKCQPSERPVPVPDIGFAAVLEDEERGVVSITVSSDAAQAIFNGVYEIPTFDKDMNDVSLPVYRAFHRASQRKGSRLQDPKHAFCVRCRRP